MILITAHMSSSYVVIIPFMISSRVMPLYWTMPNLDSLYQMFWNLYTMFFYHNTHWWSSNLVSILCWSLFILTGRGGTFFNHILAHLTKDHVSFCHHLASDVHLSKPVLCAILVHSIRFEIPFGRFPNDLL